MKKLFTLIALTAMLLGGVISANAKEDRVIDISTLLMEDASVTQITANVVDGVYCYSGTGALQFAFKHLNFDVTGYNQVIFKFAEPTPAGWCYSCVSGQGMESIPAGSTSVTYDIPDATNTLPQIALFTSPWGFTASTIKLESITLHSTVGEPRRLDCNLSSLPASSENTTWDAETNTFAWSETSYNSAPLFPAGDYSAYTTFNYNATAGTANHFRILINYSNGTPQTKYSPAAMGNVSLTWKQLGVSEDNLPYISDIRISGANDCTGDIILTSVYLEGPAEIVYKPITLYPQAGSLSSVSGWNISYPFTFAQNGSHWGSDTGSETPNIDVTGFESISIYVSSVGGGNIRVFLWDDNVGASKTVYFYPASRYDEINGKNAWGGGPGVGINAVGEYKVSLCGCTKLLGIKWDWGCNGIEVSNAWLSGSNPSVAVDEARTFSSAKILDFSSVTDVEAYIATSCDGSTVTMQQVTGAVPANTGLVLKQVNDKAIISIPTCGEATEDVSANQLVATTAPTNVPAGAYVLAGTGESLGWYSIGATAANLAAGKAYLKAPAGAAKTLRMSFGGTTGVKAIESAKAENSVAYNLAGQRVAKNAKGIVIINGKKFINK